VFAGFIPRKPYDLFTAMPQGSDERSPEAPMDLAPIAPAGAQKAPVTPPERAARAAAEAFEAAFLAEMLRYTGLNAMPAGFGGGAGEDAFGSFLTDEYARLLAERGGIGLAEQVFELLRQRASA
jgi:Rod binding domain-containing protein